ncbi:hypothetical protein [Streptomonospora wellingtoniae]|uniref:ABC transporter permease n=1 Tax=Streptomonospora wellingtoniae TaxID=3075544 RepID=A0ABU2KVU6_9ACTN|nr:hypothetical protein [Streptomonospora sp. DSM 45055]MDT0303426.1 hypothetical protein [Streptomonospora sp. DSM 45055]
MTSTEHGAPTARKAPVLTFPNVVRAEWLKLWSVPSTRILAGGSLVLFVAMGVLTAAGGVAGLNSGDPIPENFFYEYATNGITFAQLFVAAFSVLFATSEWGFGTIQLSAAAVPKRLPLLWSKALVAGAVSFTIGAFSALLVYTLSRPVLAREGLDYPLTTPGIPMIIVSTGIYLALVSWLCLGLGFLIRQGAGAMVAAFSVLLVLPIALGIIPWESVDPIAAMLPSRAGGQMLLMETPPDSLTRLEGSIVMAGWAAAALVPAAVRLRRRAV